MGPSERTPSIHVPAQGPLPVIVVQDIEHETKPALKAELVAVPLQISSVPAEPEGSLPPDAKSPEWSAQRGMTTWEHTSDRP